MLRILNEERGFEVGARELVRLRAENQWFIRARNTMGEEEVARPKVGGGGVEDEEVGGTASEVFFSDYLDYVHKQNMLLTLTPEGR